MYSTLGVLTVFFSKDKQDTFLVSCLSISVFVAVSCSFVTFFFFCVCVCGCVL